MKPLMTVSLLGVALVVAGCRSEGKTLTNAPEHIASPSSTAGKANGPSPQAVSRKSGENATTQRARTAVEKLSGAITLYAATKGAPPTSLRTLVKAGLVQSSSMRDPWGQAMSFTLVSQGRKTHKVCSSGPDRRMGTPDDLCASD
jgi:hypothetical protein